MGRRNAPGPRQIEPGEMKRGKLLRVAKGWVWVTPFELRAQEIEQLAEYWKQIDDAPLCVVPSTDLMVGEEGHLYVKDVAFAFPEEDVDAS